MRNIKISLFAVLFITISIFGCKQDNIMVYEQNAGVYFDATQPSYTFFENPDRVDIGYDSIFALIKITGAAVDYDRYIDVEIVAENKRHTAQKEMYSFGRGIVKANEYVGYVPFRVNYVKELDDSARVAVLRLVPNEEFAVSDLNHRLCLISFGNVAMRPENWSRLTRIFGNYSHSWYAFILKACGRKSIPYKYYNGWAERGITAEEAQRWPMTYDESYAIGYQVKEALIEYNNTHPEPLQHKDGADKDTDVKMKI